MELLKTMTKLCGLMLSQDKAGRSWQPASADNKRGVPRDNNGDKTGRQWEPGGSASLTATGSTTMTAMIVDGPEKARISSSPVQKRNMITPEKRNAPPVNCCRICFEDASTGELIDPCECSGTLGRIHTSCLEKWLSTSNTDHCEICKYIFVVRKKRKPFSQWWATRHLHGPQGIASDVICFVVLTPLCIAATFLCAMGANTYTQRGFWEGTGLAVLCVLLVATYCLWLSVTFRFHYKSWQRWSKLNQEIKLVVKDKSEDHVQIDSQVQANWPPSQDENNNASNNRTNHRSFIAWLFGPHNISSDSQSAIV